MYANTAARGGLTHRALGRIMAHMRIKINGHWAEHNDGLTVARLLEALELDVRRVAVERNTVIVRRKTFDQTALSDNDELEIVTLVGGG